MTTIIDKTRDLIQDLLDTTPVDIFTYYTSKIFQLSEPNAVESSIKLYANGILKADTNYTFDSNTNEITYTSSLTANDSVKVTYSAYIKYSDSELKSYIRTALTSLAVENYKTFVAKSDDIIFPTPTETEENLIALIASLNIKGNISKYDTPDLKITFNDSESKDSKIKKAIRQFRKAYGYLGYIDMDAEFGGVDL